VFNRCKKTGLINFFEKRAPTKVKYLLPACQVSRNFTERNARKFTVSFAFCAHVDVINYRKTLTFSIDHSPVLPHCASLLRIILRVISARALENGGFFFTTGPRRRGKSSFSRKRLRWAIIFFCSFELSSKFLYVKYIWANSQCWAKHNRRKHEIGKQSWLYIYVICRPRSVRIGKNCTARRRRPRAVLKSFSSSLFGT